MTIPEHTIALGKLAAGIGNIGLRDQVVRRPQPGEVLLEVLATGICGTDLHIVDEEFPSEPPVTMGHEVAGVVIAVGRDVEDSWVHERVAVETYAYYCERCDHCRSGNPNLCAQRRSIGSRVDGGFARWLTLPARNLHRLPETVGDHAGALTEPLACVTNCLFDPPIIDAGDRVLVVGPGTMGMLTAQAARAAGGGIVVAGLARDDHRLEIAADLGMETFVLGGEVGLEPGSFDVVCECSGSEGGAATALGAVRKGGSYVQVGIFGQPITFDADQLTYKELRVASGNASNPRSWLRAMALLRQGSVRLDPLLTDVVPLLEWERAFDATRAGEGMKFVLDPRSSE